MPTHSEPGIGSKSADAYLLAAALEMSPAGATLDELKQWLENNLTSVVKRASSMQADFVNHLLKPSVLEQAKNVMGVRTWQAINAARVDDILAGRDKTTSFIVMENTSNSIPALLESGWQIHPRPQPTGHTRLTR